MWLVIEFGRCYEFFALGVFFSARARIRNKLSGRNDSNVYSQKVVKNLRLLRVPSAGGN